MFFFVIIFHTLTPLSFAEPPGPFAYPIKFKQIQEIEELSGYEGYTPSSESKLLKVSIEIENKINPDWVFEYDIDEKVSLLALRQKLFLYIDGSVFVLNKGHQKSKGHLLNRIILEHEGKKVNGSLIYEVPKELSTKSAALIYFNDEFGSTVVPLGRDFKQSDLNLEPATQEKIKNNELLQVRFFDYEFLNSWKDVSLPSDMAFLKVNVAYKGGLPHESNKLNKIVKKDRKGLNAKFRLPFTYTEAALSFGILLDDGVFIPTLSKLNPNIGNVVFLPNAWNEVTMLFLIPKKHKSIKLFHGFASLNYGGKNKTLSNITFPLTEGDVEQEKTLHSFIDKKSGATFNWEVLKVSKHDSFYGKQPDDGNSLISLRMGFTLKSNSVAIDKLENRFFLRDASGKNFKVHPSTFIGDYAPASPYPLMSGIKRTFEILFQLPKEVTNFDMLYRGIQKEHIIKISSDNVSNGNRSMVDRTSILELRNSKDTKKTKLKLLEAKAHSKTTKIVKTVDSWKDLKEQIEAIRQGLVFCKTSIKTLKPDSKETKASSAHNKPVALELNKAQNLSSSKTVWTYYSFNISEKEEGIYQILWKLKENDRAKLSLLKDGEPYYEYAAYPAKQSEIKVDGLQLFVGNYRLELRTSSAEIAKGQIIINHLSSAKEEAYSAYSWKPNHHYNISPYLPVFRYHENKEEWEIQGQAKASKVQYLVFNTKKSDSLYTFFLEAENSKKLTLDYLYNSRVIATRSSQSRTLNLRDLDLLPGKHLISIKSSSDTNYKIRVTRRDRPDFNFEAEPNDKWEQAKSLKWDTAYSGHIEPSDIDLWRFVLHGESEIKFTFRGDFAASKENYKFSISDIESRKTYYITNHNPSLTLPKGTYILKLKQQTKFREFGYSFILSFSPLQERSKTIRANIITDRKKVLSHYLRAQELVVHVKLENVSTSVRKLNLKGITNHDGVFFTLKENGFSLEANEKRTLEAVLRFASEIWSDYPVKVALLNQENNELLADLDITLDDLTSPIKASWPYSEIPLKLKGKMNIAYSNFGTKVKGYKNLRQPHHLIDAFDDLGNTFNIKQETVFELPGEKTWNLKGIILEGKKSINKNDKFELTLSRKTEDIQTIQSDQLLTKSNLRYFVFDEPQSIDSFKLNLISNTKNLHLDELKLIIDDNELFPKGVNIGNNEFGAHVVNKTNNTQIIAFHHNRAAKIQKLIYKQPSKLNSTREVLANSFDCYVSNQSPLGPWKKLGTYKVSAKIGEVATIDLKNEPWVRFLKIELPDISKDKKHKYPKMFPLPDVIEKTQGETYRSILAEWGRFTSDAFYELTKESQPSHEESGIKGGSSMESVVMLDASNEIKIYGNYSSTEQSWYKFKVSKDTPRIKINLFPRSLVMPSIEILNKELLSESFQLEHSSNAQLSVSFEGQVGELYYLRIKESPLSVIFSWDTSGSMGTFIPMILSSISNFVAQMNSENERAQLLPFSNSPSFILESWSNSIYEMNEALRTYLSSGSSATHNNINYATKEFSTLREGTRALILITDAEDGESPSILERQWELLDEQRPIIFAFHNSRFNHRMDRMQDWSWVNRGRYEYFTNIIELESAFKKMKAHLRGTHSFVGSVKSMKLLGDGFLELKVNKNTKRKKDVESAIEVILDASGSMYQRVATGEYRIDAAKNVLRTLIKDDLLDDSKFALRVFGHVKADSCDTALVIKPDFVNKNIVIGKINSLKPKRRSKTPLAESIRNAQDDMSSIKGNKTLILITDGEETCDGNPKQEIENLVKNGYKIDLNIVGFDINDLQLKEEFKSWAKIAKGKYYDVRNPEGLAKTLRKAVQREFFLKSQGGGLILKGHIGDRMKHPLKAGIYYLNIPSIDVVNKKVEILENKLLALSF